MFKSIYFKIVIILLIFIITVMCTVSIITINGVSTYYINDFISQMNDCFDESTSMLYYELNSSFDSSDHVESQMSILSSYSTILGIDEYRNYYVLDLSCNVLDSSANNNDSSIEITENILSAISGDVGNSSPKSTTYVDFAIKLSNGENTYIIYIVDSLDEMQAINKVVFGIIIQALLFGIIIAVILSLFLASAITHPIQNVTKSAQLIASGEFSDDIDVDSNDEIGILADNFNYMKSALKLTIDKFDGEKTKLETIFTFLKDPVFVFYDNGTIMNFNEKASELLGESLGAYNIEKFLNDFDIPLDINIDRGYYLVDPQNENSRIPSDGIIYSERPYNSCIYDVSVGEIKYHDDDQSHTGVIVVLHDITSRFELDSARREFVANVSHELRTPLTSIKGACETVMTDNEMPNDMRDFFLNMALSETDRMIRIVSDLLVLSRLDDSRTKWNIEEFNVNELISHIGDVLKTTINSHEHQFRCKFDTNMPTISADKGRIEQVIINIISNSIKYTPNGGKIVVTTRYQNNDAYIAVCDNGHGIPEEDLPHIFERFYRVEKARTSDTGGTGLGLAIAKEIIEAHGGSISITSKIDNGSKVIIRLPIKCQLLIDKDK